MRVLAVVVTHPLRMQKGLGSNPSVSNFEKTKHLFSILPISNTSSFWRVPTCVPHGPIKACCSSDGKKHWSRPANLQCWRCPWGGGREASLNLYGRSFNAFPSNQPQPHGNYHQHFLQHAHLGTLPKVETVARYFVCGRLRNAPTVGLEPTTTRLRALCSTD